MDWFGLVGLDECIEARPTKTVGGDGFDLANEERDLCFLVNIAHGFLVEQDEPSTPT
ncbi:MAG: hypothetical protein J0I43_03520 [Microbacterium sp.]|uniref:hypothetical protein n=1 Tax=Microbacterium sp. TaxID=51671 RepID=UPI001AC896C5|nr:hypothetical protein [Microbacterium sp.]MBN9176422.1 hypothetical protein [Microbacterium sp.]